MWRVVEVVLMAATKVVAERKRGNTQWDKNLSFFPILTQCRIGHDLGEFTFSLSSVLSLFLYMVVSQKFEHCQRQI